MTQYCYQSQAPGNLMLMGEHSVLAGHPALVVAADVWLRVQWQWQDTTASFPSLGTLQVQSQLGSFAGNWSQGVIHWPGSLRFVAQALQHMMQDWPAIQHWQLRLVIDSDINPTVGLGSSAAVVAAMTVGWHHFQTLQRLPALPNLQQRYTWGLSVIHGVQGRGSGSDLAASLAGGLVALQPETGTDTLQLTPLPWPVQVPHTSPLILWLTYVGYKTTTVAVLQRVAHAWQHQPDALADLYNRMGEVTQAALQAIQQGDLARLGHCFTHYQQHMQQLGVVDAHTANVLSCLSRQPTILASKISGSGLGDCVISLLRPDQKNLTPISQTLQTHCIEPHQTTHPTMWQQVIPWSATGANIEPTSNTITEEVIP